MTDALTEVVGDRLNSDTLDKVVRNAASSWTQSDTFWEGGARQGNGLRRRLWRLRTRY